MHNSGLTIAEFSSREVTVVSRLGQYTRAEQYFSHYGKRVVGLRAVGSDKQPHSPLMVCGQPANHVILLHTSINNVAFRCWLEEPEFY